MDPPAAAAANDDDDDDGGSSAVEGRLRARAAAYLQGGGDGGMRARATELLFVAVALLNLYLQVRRSLFMHDDKCTLPFFLSCSLLTR